jgi:hypothetical protein
MSDSDNYHFDLHEWISKDTCPKKITKKVIPIETDLILRATKKEIVFVK